MNEKIKALKAAFPHTLPVFTGFIFLGIAYGILMSSQGFSIIWSILMSLFVYAGSAQYLGITFLTSSFNPIYAFLMTLMVNARHIFYGISMLDKFKEAGKLKPFLIFGQCDETFSIIHAAKAPEGVDKNWFMFFITLLNYIYWALGTALGGLLSSVISFNTNGLDFVLTALFVVIFVGQWKKVENRKPALIGLLSSIGCLIIFGPGSFIIPAMVTILVCLMLVRKKVTEVKKTKDLIIDDRGM